jgi:glutathione S-transferase
MTTTLYGWGRMFDLPCPSPYVMKADILLQLLGVPFTRATADLDAVGKHKAPYAIDDGQVIEDSTFIRWHFEAKTGRDLDAGLSPEQRGAAWMIGTSLENRLSQIMACERWLIDTNFDKGPRQFFMDVPEAMRAAVIEQVRGDFVRTMQGAGFARFTRAEQMRLARADIAAVADLLGDKPFLFGDEPTAADASAAAVLVSCNTRFFESELPDLIAAHPSLVGYLDRMNARFFAEDLWPPMG